MSAHRIFAKPAHVTILAGLPTTIIDGLAARERRPTDQSSRGGSARKNLAGSKSGRVRELGEVPQSRGIRHIKPKNLSNEFDCRGCGKILHGKGAGRDE